MARLVDAAKIRSVAVSKLAKHEMPLASNQIQINLLHRKIETNDVLETARGLGDTLIAYLPLRSGMLTGKIHADRELAAGLPRMRRMLTGISAKNLDRTAPLIDELCRIADAHQATVSQVAPAWLITYYGDTVVATLVGHGGVAASLPGVRHQRGGRGFDKSGRSLGHPVVAAAAVAPAKTVMPAAAG